MAKKNRYEIEKYDRKFLTIFIPIIFQFLLFFFSTLNSKKIVL